MTCCLLSSRALCTWWPFETNADLLSIINELRDSLGDNNMCAPHWPLGPGIQWLDDDSLQWFEGIKPSPHPMLTPAVQYCVGSNVQIRTHGKKRHFEDVFCDWWPYLSWRACVDMSQLITLTGDKGWGCPGGCREQQAAGGGCVIGVASRTRYFTIFFCHPGKSESPGEVSGWEKVVCGVLDGKLSGPTLYLWLNWHEGPWEKLLSFSKSIL